MTGPGHSGQIAQSSRIPVVVTNAVYRKLVRCRSRLLAKGLNAILDPVAQGPAQGALTPADQPMAEWPLENTWVRISVRYVNDRAEIIFLAPKFVLIRRPDPDRPRPGGASAVLLRFNRTIAIGRIAFHVDGDCTAASLSASRQAASAGFVTAGRDAPVGHNLSGAFNLAILATGTAWANEYQVIPTDVLANDSDVDKGVVITVTAASARASQGTAVIGPRVQFDPGIDFDHLVAGENANVVVSYSIEKVRGVSCSSTMTITVNGVNDAPTIAAGGTSANSPTTGVPNEDPSENTTVHQSDSAIAFDDVDLPDTHSASFALQGGGYVGIFTLDVVDQAPRPADDVDPLQNIGTRYARRAPTTPTPSSALSNCVGANNAVRLKSVADGFGAGTNLFLGRVHEAGNSGRGHPAIGPGDAERLN